MNDVKLSQEAEGLRIGEALRLDDLAAKLKMKDAELREKVADEIITIFKWANKATIGLVIGFAVVDLVFLLLPVDGFERLITSEVIMMLIGATVVQAGAAAFAIAVSLFPKSKNE